jgi:hypothetical protein
VAVHWSKELHRRILTNWNLQVGFRSRSPKGFVPGDEDPWAGWSEHLGSGLHKLIPGPPVSDLGVSTSGGRLGVFPRGRGEPITLQYLAYGDIGRSHIGRWVPPLV